MRIRGRKIFDQRCCKKGVLKGILGGSMDCRYEFEIVIKILLCSPVIGLSSLVGQNYHRTGFICITKINVPLPSVPTLQWE